MPKRKAGTEAGPIKRTRRAAAGQAIEPTAAPVEPGKPVEPVEPAQLVDAAPPRPPATDAFQQVSLPSLERFRVALVGGDVLYQPDFVSEAEAGEWMDELMRLDTYQPTLNLYGRAFPQSRHVAAYSTRPQALRYSGADIAVHSPLPPVLEAIRMKVEQRLGVSFNHVMLNRYDDGGVYIGRHSDNLNNLVIASISLGAERTFILSPREPSKAGRRGAGKAGKTGKAGKAGAGGPDAPGNDADADAPAEPTAAELKARKSLKWKLASGSLVVMQGRTQEYWKHEIPKEPAVKTGRISLTFRQLV